MANQADEDHVESRPVNGQDQSVLSQQRSGGVYEIHVRGHLSSQWSEWLEGLQVKLLDNGEMMLCGAIADQAALMGILIKLNRLNLPLISVSEIIKKNDR